MPPQSTFNNLRNIFSHLSRRRFIQLGALFIVMLLSGAVELVSLGAVLPLLAVLSDQERVWQQPLVQTTASLVGFTQASQIVLPITLLFIITALLAALIRIGNLRLNGYLAAAVGYDLSYEAYRRTLYQPYGVHVQRDSASVITALTAQISGTVAALSALFQLITSAIVATGLMACLLLINWIVALGAATLFGSLYFILAITTRKVLRRNSERIAAMSKQRIKLLQEAFGSIRDVILAGNQQVYLEIYLQADRVGRILQVENQYLSVFPRYALEAVAMISIAILGLLQVSKQGAGGSVIPLLGSLALGAQKLLPSLQQMYSGWSILGAFNADLIGVLAMLNQPLQSFVSVVEPLKLRESVRLDGVYFRYGPECPEVLHGLDVEIYRGERFGFIGSTGSGKSTTVDLLMGLLEPTAGRVLVDGADLYDSGHPELLVAWRASIAHVPQSIYLADCSIAENIAFGVPRHEIDLDRVKQAAEEAQIASFIEASPGAYQGFVGENGIRLSGGQRQRIGIARALYKQSKFIIFDEATSALDSDTENAVMSMVECLSKELTIVVIAHRLSTVRRCDRVIRLAQGKKVDEGAPEQVLID